MLPTNEWAIFHTEGQTLIILINALFSGDKESKKKQKSPASTGSASQVVVMRELKWDHQVSIFCDKTYQNLQILWRLLKLMLTTF